jgi:hypothetical protein
MFRFRAAFPLPLVRCFLFGKHLVQIGLGDLQHTTQCALESRVFGRRFRFRVHATIITRIISRSVRLWFCRFLTWTASTAQGKLLSPLPTFKNQKIVSDA